MTLQDFKGFWSGLVSFHFKDLNLFSCYIFLDFINFISRAGWKVVGFC